MQQPLCSRASHSIVEEKGNGDIDTKLLVVGLIEPVSIAVPQVKSREPKENFANEQPVFPRTSRNMRRNEKPRKSRGRM